MVRARIHGRKRSRAHGSLLKSGTSEREEGLRSKNRLSYTVLIEEKTLFLFSEKASQLAAYELIKIDRVAENSPRLFFMKMGTRTKVFEFPNSSECISHAQVAFPRPDIV